MAKRLTLGTFELVAPIWQGGMGEVWQGHHVGQRVRVAIKILTSERARDPYYLAAFRNEVRAVARLEHPGIIRVFDCGEVSEAEAAASNGRLPLRSPFLVMELSNNGSLADLPVMEDWSRLRAVLHNLLDALAHAHARRVIHRDIKPGNVLLKDTEPDGVILTDFGIAHAGAFPKSDREGAELIATRKTGTPHYMAPEQVEARTRDQGPWTDLYALGCLAYRLACGHPPFWEGDASQVMRCHLLVPVPEPATMISVPEGFDEWLFGLLAKHPQNRYRSAADAACALERLGAPTLRPPRAWLAEPTEGSNDGASRGGSSVSSTEDSETLPDISTLAVEPAESLDLVVLPGRSPLSDPLCGPPPFPEDWRREVRPQPSMQLVGAGLGLYGLRPIPMVDREAERDTLWRALGKVSRTRRAHLVLLSGVAGVGKSRLAEWLAERAQELGAAQVLYATHGPIAGPAFGLRRMIANHLRCAGLDRKGVEQRVRSVITQFGLLSDDDVALAELIGPSLDDQGRSGSSPPARFTHARERYVVIRRLLEALSQERPLIVWLDDVQWGADALTFAEYFLESQRLAPIPALLVCTAREETLAERPQEADLLASLLHHDVAERIEVGPLAPQHHAALVERLLGLAGELAHQVEARTEGNPLFAVQLVGDWVQRGVLEVTEGGFALRDGADAALPDDIYHGDRRSQRHRSIPPRSGRDL